MISLPCVQREQGKLLAAQGDELDLFLDQRAVLVVLRKMKALTVARGFESALVDCEARGLIPRRLLRDQCADVALKPVGASGRSLRNIHSDS